MRVLVVEDEHKIANSIKKGLEQEAFSVDVAYSGNHGADLALSEEYDVIILDRMLPEIEGVEIVKIIREEKIHTPILLLTAKGQVEDRVEGLNAGADDYLAKPFAFAELIARVRALERRPKKTLGTILKVADLILDTNKLEVRRSGVKINLSGKEFALLEFLMRHAGQIIKKEQLIDHVWDYDSQILPNTVEVFIGYLRNKIDRPFKSSPNLIHTARGFGYKIENTTNAINTKNTNKSFND